MHFKFETADLYYYAIAKFSILQTEIEDGGDDVILCLSCETPQLSYESLAEKSEIRTTFLKRQAQILRDNETADDNLVILLDVAPAHPPFLDSPAPSA